MELKDNWTVIQTSKLIASYKRYPNLWDCNHQFYRNRALRKTCLKKIANKVSETKASTTINDVRAKLKTLRSQFGKEKRRRETIVAKRGIHEYTPKLWCYDELKFIDVVLRPLSNCQESYLPSEQMNSEILDDDAMITELLEDQCEPIEETIEKRGRPSRFPSWTKEQTFTLLQLLKRNPLIYDTTHPLYANPYQRTKAFRDMLSKLKGSRPNATVPDMRAKLKTLRSQFLKEKRLVKISQERRGRVQYIPKLWCFDHLQFLDERGKFLEDEREVSTSFLENDFQVGDQPDDCYVGENENEIYVKSFDDSDIDDANTAPESPVNAQRVPQTILHQKCLSLVESLTSYMKREQEASPQNDESSKTPQAMLGKMVEVELLKVPEDIFEEAKWKIIKALEEASKEARDAKLYKNINGDCL